jgi:hypothetical protein
MQYSIYTFSLSQEQKRNNEKKKAIVNIYIHERKKIPITIVIDDIKKKAIWS